MKKLTESAVWDAKKEEELKVAMEKVAELNKPKSWHERGEFPPVGEKCLVNNLSLHLNEFEECEILFLGQYTAVYTSTSCVERVGKIEDLEFKPLPPENTAKQEEIEDMAMIACHVETWVTINGIQHDLPFQTCKEIAKVLYEAGYTKSKVKPLSCEVFQCLADANDTHQEDYESLIENGYCIGSAD